MSEEGHKLDNEEMGKPKWLMLLEMAPKDWPQAQQLLSPDDSADIYAQLNQVALRAAFLTEYLERMGMGVGHEEAVRLANTRLRDVRRALGYTYPAAQQYNI